MPGSVKVFVSYSRKDPQYLEDDSLLGYLKGLEAENVEFWTDRNIRGGELWDDVIKANIQNAHIVLALISQGFLDSKYCQDVEIRQALAQKSHLFPIILSPCEWRRHHWLSSRQFLPGGDKTIEEHYRDPGRRKRLFLEIREQLRERVELVRQTLGSASKSPTMPTNPYSGKTKIAFCTRLGNDWQKLADYLEIPPSDQARFERGDESRGIWVWLHNRGKLQELPVALEFIERPDLAELLAKDQ
jgi:hypothetical protein